MSMCGICLPSRARCLSTQRECVGSKEEGRGSEWVEMVPYIKSSVGSAQVACYRHCFRERSVIALPSRDSIRGAMVYTIGGLMVYTN